MSDAVGRAEMRLSAIVDWQPVADWVQRRKDLGIRAASRSVKYAVAWWLSQAQPRIPVAGTVNRAQRRAGLGKGAALYTQRGRGMLRKSTHAFYVEDQRGPGGGIISGTRYAIWLAAGTRRIAGGRVMGWKPGAPLITDWPAKSGRIGRESETNRRARSEKGRTMSRQRARGLSGTAMPIVIPWHRPAWEMLYKQLREEI